MSKLSKEECARYSGAEWLLRLAKEKGLDVAEQELTNRGIRNIPLGVTRKDIEDFYRKQKSNIILCMTLIAAATLHDEYDFEVEELNRYINRFNTKADCLCKEYVSWEDLQQIIKEETGIFIPLPKIE